MSHLAPALIVAILALAACDVPTIDDDPDDPMAALAGSYDLVSINDDAVPYEAEDGTILSSGTLALTEGGAYTFTLTGQDPGSSESWTDSFTGTFAIDGSTVTLAQADDFYPNPGTFTDAAVTLPLAETSGGADAWSFHFER